MAKVVVIGSGIAGLIAAAEASREHQVTLITKSVLAESNTHYAQGGIAAVMGDNDSIREHVADTLTAGAGLSWRPAVDVLCSEGPARIADLIAFGVEFDRQNGELARGLEAAHSHARILHAGGDATGARISDALVAEVRSNVSDIRENTLVIDLVLGVSGGISGVKLLDADGHETIDADYVILASGGAGNLYRHTTNPSVTTGDGVALGLRAGAVLADLEFYQFHPTALAVPGSFLISEAVRGEGAVLINNAGERFMQKIHPDAELAPRDVVARASQAEMIRQGGQPVLLDATMLGTDFLNKRFPTISAVCRSYGLNWGKQPIPVTPAAHYWMGGIATDVWGRTSVEGLFAVGEVACTGAHGANRLASNSLLESVVFSHRAISVLTDEWPEQPQTIRWSEAGPLAQLEMTSNAVDPEAAIQVVDRVELQTLMWDLVGLARDAEGLRETLAKLRTWRPAPEKHRLFPDWEDANLLLLAEAVTMAALAREESRGAHYRLDYPDAIASMARPITVRKV